MQGFGMGGSHEGQDNCRSWRTVVRCRTVSSFAPLLITSAVLAGCNSTPPSGGPPTTGRPHVSSTPLPDQPDGLTRQPRTAYPATKNERPRPSPGTPTHIESLHPDDLSDKPASTEAEHARPDPMDPGVNLPLKNMLCRDPLGNPCGSLSVEGPRGGPASNSRNNATPTRRNGNSHGDRGTTGSAK